MVKAVIFDFDMTLVDSLDTITTGINKIADHFNLPHKTSADVLAVISLETKAFWRALWGSYEDSWAVYFRQEVAKFETVSLKPYAGAVEMLKALRESGILVGLATNRTSPWPSLNTVGLAKYFDTAVGLLDVAAPKPSPDVLLTALKQLGVPPDQTIYIGDALCDMEAAKAAGVRGLGLLQGGQSEEDLLRAGAWQVRPSLNDCRPLLGLPDISAPAA